MSGMENMPDDIDALKALVLERTNQVNTLSQENQQLVIKNESLQEQLNLALARRYAASSEKISPDQIRLFDEAEVDFTDFVEENESNAVVSVPAHDRKKRGRKPLPKTLPRVDVIHELPVAECFCPHDGAVLKEINEVISEQLDIVPAKIQVIRHVRKQYACGCGQCIKTAPLPAQPIPKSMASPGLLAHVAVSKYQDALPLYRQEKILQRIGVDIPRATLANWMIQVGQLIQPVINLMREKLIDYDIIQMDETPVQVLKEPGKTAQSKSYLWVQRGGPPEQPVILYDYDPSKGSEVPVRLLEGFKGYLQTDGNADYNKVVEQNDLTHLGCMAHARRKFGDAVKAQGKKKKKTGKAQQGLALIQKLYRIEKQAKQLSPEDRDRLRQEKAKPTLEKLRGWLDQALPQTPPGSTLGRALNYLNNEWDKLIRYLEDGRLKIDNNGAENTIRPFVVGRKNWLFSNSVKGVNASANLYSLIETAKANDLEPYAYLRYLFTALPKTTTVEDIEALMPGAVENDQIIIR